LKEDTRNAGATASILVSEELPKSMDRFGFEDGILVTTYHYAIPLAVLVRRGIMQTAAAKSAAENKDETLEMVYQYLQSDAFRHRIGGYVDSVKEMKTDLDSERLNIAKLYGELQGIMGTTLPDIKQLSLDSGIEDED